MPELIGINHDDFMNQYTNSGHSKVLNKRLSVFLVDKDRSLAPCRVQI